MGPKLQSDPALETEQAQAENDLVSSLTNKTSGDSAALMARYGTQLAMAGAQTSPLVAKATGGISPTPARVA